MWNKLIVSMLFLSMMAPAGARMIDLHEVADLHWMSGLWANETSEEYWSEPKNGTMFGYNRQLRDGGTPFFEHLQLTQGPKGVSYWANPLGKGWTQFELTDAGSNFAVFENKQHDYPTRIVYHRGGVVMKVEISDMGENRKSWTWRKIR